MNKKLLLEKYIKVAVRKALKEQEQQQKKAEKAMYLVYRFPGLKKVMEDIMSPSFGRFTSNIDIVAPKPTTFRVELVNGQDFNIIYLGKNQFKVKVAGKKYYLSNIGELERAIQAVADLLELNYGIQEKEETPSTPEEPSPEAAAKDKELAADLSAAAPEATPPPAEAPAAGEETAPEEETPPAEA